jgi:hypothetical protein
MDGKEDTNGMLESKEKNTEKKERNGYMPVKKWKD